MAYTHTDVLSKVKIGNTTYYLKDADLRTIVEGFNESIVKGQLGLVTEQNKLVYSQDIKSYVDSMIAVGIIIEVVQTLPTASADTMGKIYMIAQSGGKTDDYYNEYITVRSGEEGSYTYAFELIGDTRVDLSGYVNDVKYKNKTLKQQKGNGTYTDVHTFGNLADANTASGTVDGQTISGVTASYTPEGTVSTPTITVTPATDTVKVLDTAGSVTAGTAATFTEGTFTPNVPTAIDTTKFSGGSKVADTFTQGSLPSLGDATTGSFATAGLTAVIDEDNEMLVLEAASTATAVTAQGTFSAGTLPSFTEGAYTPASLGEGFYTAGTAAKKTADSFNGGTPTAVTLPTFEDATVVTGITSATASQPEFTGTSGTANVGNIVVTAKTVTVNPDTNE